MKKGLSVLLIAAALFGFYGGAVNLNDVLASKTYWEKEGERSTADMNKLEDGLNQLKDNEQAYLDGVDQVADGEEALAEGEQTLANGYKQLAQGESDYAAAPGKLKDGKKKLSDITRLINGLNKAYRSYNNYSVSDDGKKGMAWVTGFEKKASKSDFSDAGLRQARQVITQTLNTDDNKKSVALIGSLAGNDKLLDDVNKAKTYAQFDKSLKNMIDAFDKAQAALEKLSAMAKANAADDKRTIALKAGLNSSKTVDALGKKVSELTPAEMNTVYKAAVAKDLDATLKQLEQLEAAGVTVVPAGEYKGYPVSAVKAQVEEGIEGRDNIKALIDGRAEVAGKVSGVLSQAGDKLSMLGSLDPRLAALGPAMKSLASNSGDNATFAATFKGMQDGLSLLAAALDEKIEQIKTNKATFKSWRSGYSQLKDGQEQLADTSSGIPYAFQNMMSNSTLRKALKSKVPGTYAKLSKYTGNRLASDDMDKFNEDMKDISKIIKKALPVLREVKAKGQKDYAQGLRDYHAAPGKLASARSQLAAGEQTLADGRKTLADGKNKLAEYEDGEAQVRDGLATLMGTEANGGLQSILDRRNGDDDFLNGDAHLELVEGLEAVGVGRAYQSDSGELITTEITRRAVGAGLGLAAGALAVLAGLLSFLKKHRGAGVCAILAAIAGGAGIGVGTSAGMEFSRIAGSGVGSTPMVAAGILAAVALIHAIVHFSAKKDA